MVIPGKYITLVVVVIIWSIVVAAAITTVAGIIIFISDYIKWRKRKW